MAHPLKRETASAQVRDAEAAVQRAPHICEVNLQPRNAPRIYARSIFSPAEASAYMRGHFAALQRQIACMRGENAEMKQQIERNNKTKHTMEKKPLYRKVNKITHNGFRSYSQETDRYRNERRKKQDVLPSQLPIKRRQRRHFNDYAPLYRFLLSRVGCKWDEVFSECISRLDMADPIFDMVVNVNPKGLVVDKALEDLPKGFHDWWACEDSRTGWSTLYVDDKGTLQFVDENYVIDFDDELYGILTASWNGQPIYPSQKK